jgi:hypothetical protein
LVSLNWDGFGLADSTWAAIIIVVAMVIGTTTMLRNRDIAYGLVLIWAYLGILLRHTAATAGFHNRYPVVVATVIGCLVVYVVAEAAILLRRRRSVAP